MRSLTVLLLIALSLVVVHTPAQASAGVSLRLTINRIHQIESPDSTGDGNYFPEIRIGDGGLQRRGSVEDDDFNPSVLPDPWIFTQDVQVPDDTTKIPILIRLWDEDGGLSGGDDKLDISPQNQDVDLELEYDIGTDTWTGPGDLLTPGQGYVEGDGDPNFPNSGDGKRAGIGFTIERTSGGLPDTDGDGIPDVVERLGIRKADGSLLFDLKALGANPCRKTVILQIDYMDGAADGHTHRPKDAGLQDLKRAFEDSPAKATQPCPYPGTPLDDGVDFIPIVGKAIAEQAAMSDDSSAFRNTRALNFPKELMPYAHYTIFAHDLTAGSSVSGRCCEPVRGNRDFIVTLGEWRTWCILPGRNKTLESTKLGDDFPTPTQIGVGPDHVCNSKKKPGSDDIQVMKAGTGPDIVESGTARDQAGTVMHELGHALGLSHGGNTRTNFKPNYLSIMNYAYEPGGIPTGPDPAPRRLDYSRGLMPNLDRDHLDESKGVGPGDDYARWNLVANDPSQELFGAVDDALDWNDNKVTDPPTIKADINSEDDVCVLAGTNGKIDSPRLDDDVQFTDAIIQGGDNQCDSMPTPGTDDTGRDVILADHDDWGRLKFDISSPGGGQDSGPEIDFLTVAQMEADFLDFYAPDLATTKTVDKESAQPGDTLAYTVKVDNVGRGGAKAVKLTDTLPDGSKVTRDLPDLAAAGSRDEPYTYTVPCDTANGATLTNTATVEGRNVAGGAEENTDNNTGKATTAIKAPQLTLDASATPTAGAAEAVTTTLKVTNTGGASATDATLAYTPPAGVYYSTALDQGSGPRPSSVTGGTPTWKLGSMDAGATTTVRFTTRSSLLAVGGTVLTGQAKVSYGNAKGCVYTPVTASSSSTVTEVAPSRNPRPTAIWTLTPSLWTPESLARVQATDQRFDGIDGTAPDGQLSQREVGSVFTLPALQPRTLRAELLTTYLNVGSRRINAATAVRTLTIERLGLHTVGDAARHGQKILGDGNVITYTDATLALVEINTGVAERY
ncbi:CARDB domain-containing protein [Nonomuraea insulae]|uniref:CARDB domain-containing protein n=1 Tax=Nonomuraea insulae TaxID=1616787 RepID=A0ABW1CFQ6_9ACTN